MWKKGQSGNPSGRPRDIEGARALIRERGPELLRRTLAIALGEDADAKTADQLRAQEVCYSYWLGKPSQAVELTFGDEGAEVLRATLERMRKDPLSAAAMLTLAETAAKGDER
jgi:chromosome segregation and condensation protein ScpB